MLPNCNKTPPDFLNVIEVDEAWIVIDKPAGLLSVPGRGEERQDCVARRVESVWPEARVVHRLDQATSGLMVLARGLENQRFLSRAFEFRQVSKGYIADILGSPVDDHGSVDLPLRCDWPNRPRQMVDLVQGRSALTYWAVLERWHNRTRVALTPVTGRSHQLRVHMLSIGHPILGDELYMPAGSSCGEPRLHLHATKLELPHPDGGKARRFDCSPPF
jgi:tRNA pseudouridine32 synthase / 23S rRNA pseudouridine746 synthase